MSIRVGLRHMARVLGKPIIDELRKAANIFSAYNLCSTVPNEKLTAQPTSVINILNYLATLRLTPTPASVYDLSTAPT